mmetsp:Transcript_60485/g.187823  ORF Transcript_60485/g.187823 Transcript_60485/m.187823 type:complete len:280 (+) Transcript_60485:760-1599(+)
MGLRDEDRADTVEAQRAARHGPDGLGRHAEREEGHALQVEVAREPRALGRQQRGVHGPPHEEGVDGATRSRLHGGAAGHRRPRLAAPAAGAKAGADFFSFIGAATASTGPQQAASAKCKARFSSAWQRCGRAGVMSSRLEELQREYEESFRQHERYSSQVIAKKDRAIRRLQRQLADLSARPPQEPGALSSIVDSVLSQFRELALEAAPEAGPAAPGEALPWASRTAATPLGPGSEPASEAAGRGARVSRVRVRLQARRERGSMLASAPPSRALLAGAL